MSTTTFEIPFKVLRRMFEILFLTLVVGGSAFGATWIVDPGIGDTVRIDSVFSQQTGTSIVPIYFYNDEPLGGIEVTIEILSTEFIIDSFSWVGGRGNGGGTIRDQEVFANQSITIVTIPLTDPLIPAGTGLLGKLYVHYTPGIANQTAFIDSLTILNGQIVYQTSFSDGSSNRFIPRFRRGAITVGQVCCTNRRGNVNNDALDNVTVVDLTYLVSYIFRQGPAPVCREEGNVNGDSGESINVVDITYLVNYLFKSGPQPPLCP
jgi:hypothetical protein